MNKAAALFHALALADPELSVVLTDNEHIQRLNLQWRQQDKSTDVLSFPLHEPATPGMLDNNIFALGDVVISIEYAQGLLESREHHRRVADELGVPPDQLPWNLEDEVCFLLIHGLLHLVGYDHASEAEETEMKAQEKRLWQAIQDK
jgi:probable rRNA maturation factor